MQISCDREYPHASTPKAAHGLWKRLDGIPVRYMTLIINSETGKVVYRKQTLDSSKTAEERYLPEAVFNLSCFLVGTLVEEICSRRVSSSLMNIVSLESSLSTKENEFDEQ